MKQDELAEQLTFKEVHLTKSNHVFTTIQVIFAILALQSEILISIVVEGLDLILPDVPS
jgi:hypothetical protein